MENKKTGENISSIIPGFSALGIAPALLEELAKLRFISPTPIQTQAIPVAISGKDVVGIAQTGTGKTLAFGIPIIQKIIQTNGKALVLLPTRELAIQVGDALKRISQNFNVRMTVLIGGVSIRQQIQTMPRNVNVIIATPGRLIDHLNHRTVRLDDVGMVALDEADLMLDMGFAPQIQKILNALTGKRQMMLFSATMPPEIMKIAAQHMQLPIRIEVAPAGTPAASVTQEIFIIQSNAKNRLLEKLLEQYIGTTLVFTKTKHTAKRLTSVVRTMGHTVAEIHSNRSLPQRREALEGFKRGKYRVLIATDIASRGIDVKGISLVINYDLPVSPDDYVHRIGRTARAGAGGHAISFVAPNQRNLFRNIEKLIKKSLPISKLPELPPERPAIADIPFEETQQRPRRFIHQQSERPSRRTTFRRR